MKVPVNQKQAEKLTKRWERAHALWKEASEKSQKAIATYHWNVLDDRVKWNWVVVMRMREQAAFKKAATAHQSLVEFVRTVSSEGDSE